MKIKIRWTYKVNTTAMLPDNHKRESTAELLKDDHNSTLTIIFGGTVINTYIISNLAVKYVL